MYHLKVAIFDEKMAVGKVGNSGNAVSIGTHASLRQGNFRASELASLNNKQNFYIG